MDEYWGDSMLSDFEEELKRRFQSEEGGIRPLSSDAEAAPGSVRHDRLVLPDEKRGKLPFTKDKYLVREDPHLVAWERDVRKFLRRLSPEHGHRVTAIMVYEWATGIRIADMLALEEKRRREHPVEGEKRGRPAGVTGTWRSDLRRISKCLETYFGRPGMTWIAGRKVPRAYKVKPGFYIRRHRPMTLTLYAEYVEGTLNP